MNVKRLLHGSLWGLILGVVCVLGAMLRAGRSYPLSICLLFGTTVCLWES